MRTALLVVTACTLSAAASLPAQRRVRIGPTLSSISLDDASGASHSFSAIGGTVALLTGDDAETGLTIARYRNLSTSGCERSLTFYGLDDNYYPVGPGGIAPFASTELGLARVTDADKGLLGICGAAATTSELGYGFGLGVRVNAGKDATALVEGRFFQVPNSAIQSLELRANLSLLLGSPRPTELLQGTVGPEVGMFIPLSGPLEGRGPAFGVRFRRDTKKRSNVLGLSIDYAPLRVRGSCTNPGCSPNAVLFAPGYEASARPGWGRVYFTLGPLLAGFYGAGPDRGVAQGLHGGVGVDLDRGSALINVNTRVLWMQRNSGESVFTLQIGAGISPAIHGP
jgi:hypothetical protein